MILLYEKTGRKVIIVRVFWKRWLKFAEILGTIQMVIILTVVYVLFVMPMALVFKLVGDPFTQRNPHKTRWLRRETGATSLFDMKRQG